MTLEPLDRRSLTDRAAARRRMATHPILSTA